MFNDILVPATGPSDNCANPFSLSYLNGEIITYSIIKERPVAFSNNKVDSFNVFRNILAYFLIALSLNFILSNAAVSQDKDDLSISSKTENSKLIQALMCEEIKNRAPYNPGVTFSSSLGSVICFTEFELLVEKTVIYHKYYFRDKLSAKKKLTLNPPNWATFSSIQLRETDKGPWRVEIVDAEDNILYILRFSVTD